MSLRAAEAASARGSPQPQILVGGVPADLDDKSLREAFERSDDDSQVTVCIQVDDAARQRLDTFLSKHISILSRSSLNRIIKAHCVTLNDKVPKPSAKLKVGDTVIVNLPPPRAPSVLAEDIPIDILLEDDQIAVVNKQANLVVHPAPTVPNGTLVNALAFHFQNQGKGQLSSVGSENARPGIVHRLDKNTTGAMIIAKTEGAHWSLYEQFAVRSTDKRYLALVHGSWKLNVLHGEIDEPLGRHPYDPVRFAVCAKGEGKPSQTRFSVRERYDGYTLVELHLLTGRTHQIRVHLAHIGHPIVGDDLYGGRPLVMGDVLRMQDLAKLDSKSPKQVLLNRQALHSSVLTFTHPSTEERVQMHARAPRDMAVVVNLLRQHRLEQIVQVDASAAVDMHRIIPFEARAVSARDRVRAGELTSTRRGALRADTRERASVPGSDA
jgi:23S rRNA pseudouridine1911/1915/1917 synthase